MNGIDTLFVVCALREVARKNIRQHHWKQRINAVDVILYFRLDDETLLRGDLVKRTKDTEDCRRYSLSSSCRRDSSLHGGDLVASP